METNNEKKIMKITVLLVGVSVLKNEFLDALMSNEKLEISSHVEDWYNYPSRVGEDYINYVMGSSKNVIYQIIDLPFNRIEERMKRSLPKCQAIIYFNPPADFNHNAYDEIYANYDLIKMTIEKQRDANTCIALDFNAINLDAITCLHEIDNLITSYPDEMNKTQQIPEKIWIVNQEKPGSGSLFGYLPQEIKEKISNDLIKNEVIFDYSIQKDKPIYIKIKKQLGAEKDTSSDDEDSSGNALF